MPTNFSSRYLSMLVNAGETNYLKIYSPPIEQVNGAFLIINTVPELNEVTKIPVTADP